MKILTLFSRVSSAFPGTSQLMDLKVLGIVVPVHELLANSWAASCLAEWLGKSHVIVSPWIVRLVLEAGINGTILEGSE